MLDLPQRRKFATRDEFAAAVSVSFEELWQQYLAEPISHVVPDWAQARGIHSIALPLAVASEGGAEHGISNIVRHMIEMNKTAITRLARVEKNGSWFVFFEAK